MKMKNLKILMVRDGPKFSTCPKHLPNSLKVLHWANYPSWSFPPDFNYKQLKCLRVERITYVYTRHPAIYDMVCRLWLVLLLSTSQLQCNLQILFRAFLEQWKWLLCSLFLSFFRWKQRNTLPPFWPLSLFLGFFRWKRWLPSFQAEVELRRIEDICQLILIKNLHRSIRKFILRGHLFVYLSSPITISLLLAKVLGVRFEDLLLLISISILLVKVHQSQVHQSRTYPIDHVVWHCGEHHK